ncbi:MAG: tectonin domain-containing protein [Nannocystaceae bacterium]
MKYLVNPIPPFAANAPGNAGADARVFTISPEHSSLVLTLRDEVALTQLPEKFIHVSAGVDGEVWAIDASHRIFRRTGSTWTQISGTLKQVSVGSPEHIWGVQGDGDIFRWTGESWQKISGTLKQVAVASDGAVWGVQGDGDIFVRRGDKWEQISGTLAQIAVGSRRNVWGAQTDGDVFVRTGDKWIKVATGLKQVSIATDGAVWAVDPLSRLHRWDGKTFELQPGALTQISVGSASDIWGVDAVNRTWFNGGAAKALLVQQIWAEDERQQWRFIRQDDGSFRVQNVASGLVLDVRGASKNDEADVLGFPWHGGDNQRWLLTELGDGRFSISAKHSGKSLDVFRAFREAGAKLIQFTWHSNANQRFRFAEVRPSSAIFNASATLFADPDFGGKSLTLGVGCYGIADLNAIGNDKVSSLKVPRGLRVTLCQHVDYKGRRKSFTADTPYVGDDFNDITSSVMVEKVVSIHEGSNFQGKSSTLGIGKHNIKGLGIANDSLSSLRVPQGLMVITYQHADFKGAQRIYLQDTPSVGAGFHDRSRASTSARSGSRSRATRSATGAASSSRAPAGGGWWPGTTGACSTPAWSRGSRRRSRSSAPGRRSTRATWPTATSSRFARLTASTWSPRRMARPTRTAAPPGLGGAGSSFAPGPRRRTCSSRTVTRSACARSRSCSSSPTAAAW